LPICSQCRAPVSDPASPCELCQAPLCRKCRIFLSEEEFALAGERPPELLHSYYCGACHDEHVIPFQERYQETLEQAKQVNIIYKGSKSTIRVLRKATQAIQVANIRDRDEAILRLAYQAALLGFNAVIEVEVTSQKLRNEGWQKSAWSGHGVPAEIRSHET